jgi:hypothetical protein
VVTAIKCVLQRVPDVVVDGGEGRFALVVVVVVDGVGWQREKSVGQ